MRTQIFPAFLEVFRRAERHWPMRMLAAAAILLLFLLAGAIRQWSLNDRSQKMVTVQPPPPVLQEDEMLSERLLPNDRPKSVYGN